MSNLVDAPTEPFASAAAAQVSDSAGTQSLGSGADSQPEIVSHAGVAFLCDQLERRGFREAFPQPRILVAGCGGGHEAVVLQRHFQADVDAIDVELQVFPEHRQAERVTYQAASVCGLPFPDDSFAAVFYHHVIEHVDDPTGSLAEIHRVLAPGGWLFIGTPNRHRLVSAVGAHRQTDWDSNFRNKLRENVQDWTARLTGKFRNELGAHAGFSRRELDGMLAVHFPTRDWLTREYLEFKYRDLPYAIAKKLAFNQASLGFVAPGIYVLSRKGK